MKQTHTPTMKSPWAHLLHPVDFLTSLIIRVMEFIRPVREALDIISLAPGRGEVVLVVQEGAWAVLEEALRLEAVTTTDTIAARDITNALNLVRRYGPAPVALIEAPIPVEASDAWLERAYEERFEMVME